MKNRLFKYGISCIFCLAFILVLVESGYPQGADIAKYPSRAVTYINTITPGGPTDLAIRLISKEAEKFLGQPIPVVNKTGGAGSIGFAAIAASRPDGYTIGYGAHSSMYVAPVVEKVPYNPVTGFQYIMQFGGFNFGVIVKNDSPFKTFKDLIAYALKNPKGLTCGTTGPVSMQYLITDYIAKKEKVQFAHIPFKGNMEMTTGLIGGHIAFGVGDFNYSLIESGQIRLLLLLRDEPSAEYPQTPILKDLGYDIPAPMALNVAGPRGIPREIVAKIEDAYTKAMKAPAFIKGMKEDLRLPIVHRSSKELEPYVAHNVEIYTKLLKESGGAK